MTVAVTWTLPTQRTDNTALPVSAIAFTRFSLSTNGGAFVQLVDVPAPTVMQELPVTLTPGSYVIRSVVYDRQTPARTSTPVDTPFVIPVAALAPPRPVTNQTAVVTP